MFIYEYIHAFVYSYRTAICNCMGKLFYIILLYQLIGDTGITARPSL